MLKGIITLLTSFYLKKGGIYMYQRGIYMYQRGIYMYQKSMYTYQLSKLYKKFIIFNYRIRTI